MRGRLALVLVLVLFGFGRQARADGKRDLEDGIAFYENLDNERAVERLKAASVAKDLDAAARAKAFLYLGMLQFETGDKLEAQKSWKQAFQLKRNIEIPSGTSPKTIDAIEAVRVSEGAGGGGGAGAGEPGGAKAKPPEGTGKTETPPVGGNAGAVTSGGAGGGKPAGGAVTETPAIGSGGAQGQNQNLVVQTPPPEDDAVPTWLIIGGIAAGVIAVATVIFFVARSGDCKDGGGCLTVNFQ